MVRTNVEEDTDIKGEAVDPFHQVGLAGYFHNKMCSSIINCLGHHLKEINTFRSC